MTAGFDVLLVDDDDEMLDALGALLEAHGYAVRVADSADQAMEILHSQRPSLVISDLRMPKVSGTDLLHQIRREPGLEQVPVVMITGVPSPTNDDQASAWIQKPLHVPELLKVIESLGGPELRRSIP